MWINLLSQFSQYASWASILFYGLAAVFWFLSASVRIPSNLRVSGMAATGRGGMGPISGQIKGLSRFVDSLRQQSRFNRYGAAISGLAVFCQLLSNLPLT
jgi:hypothetical protein